MRDMRDMRGNGSFQLPEQLDVTDVKKSLFSALFGIALMGIMFFSGFFALGTYILSLDHSSFLKRAQQVEAEVVRVEEKERREKKSGSSKGSLNRPRIFTDYILTFKFSLPSGSTFQAKLNDGTRSLYSVGDTVRILYDPDNPQKVILAEDREKGSILETISTVSGSIFFLALGLFWYCRKK